MAIQPQSATLQNNQAVSSSPPRLLYVEDDVISATLFKQRMEREGFDVDLSLIHI